MTSTLQIDAAQWNSLVRSCSRVTGNVHDAEDAVQDAALAVLKRMPHLQRPEDEIAGYLFVAARNRALSTVTRRRQQAAIDETLADPSPAVDELAERRERRAELAAALQRIPERQARALALVDVHGVSGEEAAEVLELKPNAVNQLVFRARRSMRAELAVA